MTSIGGWGLDQRIPVVGTMALLGSALVGRIINEERRVTAERD